MRYTLIEIVQRILESMDSDEVSTIAQTTESLAVANIVKECYFDVVGKLDFPEHQGIFQLDASGDNTKPVLMSLPSNALDILTLKYNENTVSDPNLYTVMYLPLDEFIARVTTYNLDDTNVDSLQLSVNGGVFTFKYQNDKDPDYYTSYDDRNLIFDSYDTSKDTTLQKVKTYCYGNILPTFEMTDTYIPDLDARQFQLLINEAKAQAFQELKQVENPKAEKKARQNHILAQRTKDAIDQRSALQRIKRFGR